MRTLKINLPILLIVLISPLLSRVGVFAAESLKKERKIITTTTVLEDGKVVDETKKEVIQDIQADDSRLRPWRFNLQVSPLGVLARRYNGSVTVGLTDHLSLGAKLTRYNHASNWLFDSENGWEGGLRLTYYPNYSRVEKSTWFIRGGVLYASYDRDNDLENSLSYLFGSAGGRTWDEIRSPVLELLFGYQAFVSHSINVEFCGGFQAYHENYLYYDNATRIQSDRKASFTRRSVSIEINIGYAF